MRSHGKVDLNQREIVKALRDFGASVAISSSLGGGFPDIACAWSGRNHLFELKSPGGKLTPDQIEFHSTWRAPIGIIHTAEEAIEWLVMKNRGAK